jgi:hypothetical protein
MLPGGTMRNTALKEKLIKEIEEMPAGTVREVANFVNYLSLKEDTWFIDFVNKRTRLAEADRKAGKKFTTLKELQKEYK